jgi:hypothetical protein
VDVRLDRFDFGGKHGSEHGDDARIGGELLKSRDRLVRLA